jgi:hypothetical protein
MVMCRTLQVFVSLVLASVVCEAQTVRFTLKGEGDDGFGEKVASIGDVNADGIPDLLIAADRADEGGFFNSGSVRVHSGVDGALLVKVDGTDHSLYLGGAVAGIGDVNGDGRPDMLVGSSQYGGTEYYGRAWVFSGSDGHTLHTFTNTGADDYFGCAVTGLGDVSGDGIPDFAIGANEWETGAGYVRVYSGASWGQLFQVTGTVFDGRFGHEVSGIGDINGDGRSDLLVGAYKVDYYKGAIYAYSGLNGAPLYTIAGNGELGLDIDGIGDCNGDNVPDFVAGSPGEGVARIHSGIDGAPLMAFSGEPTFDRFGQTVAGLGDIDGDGTVDVAIGAIWADETGDNSGSVYFFSGASGALLFRVDGYDGGDGVGRSIAAIGDTDGDSLQELLVGRHRSPGEARLVSAACLDGGIYTYCEGAPNSYGPGARIGYRGSRSIVANNFRLTVTGCPPHTFGIFFFAHGQTQSPWGDGWQCVIGQYIRRLLPPIVTDQAGFASLAIDYAQPPTDFIPGGQANFQFWYRDPMGPGGTGYNFSDALCAMFCQ